MPRDVPPRAKLHTPERVKPCNDPEPYQMNDVNIDDYEEDHSNSNHAGQSNDSNGAPHSTKSQLNGAIHKLSHVRHREHDHGNGEVIQDVVTHRKNGTQPSAGVHSAASVTPGQHLCEACHLCNNSNSNANVTPNHVSTTSSSRPKRLFYIVPQNLSPALEKGDLLALRLPHTCTRAGPHAHARRSDAAQDVEANLKYIPLSHDSRLPPSLPSTTATTATTNTAESTKETAVVAEAVAAKHTNQAAALTTSESAAASPAVAAAATATTGKAASANKPGPSIPDRPVSRTQAVRHYLRIHQSQTRPSAISTPSPCPSQSTQATTTTAATIATPSPVPIAIAQHAWTNSLLDNHHTSSLPQLPRVLPQSSHAVRNHHRQQHTPTQLSNTAAAAATGERHARCSKADAMVETHAIPLTSVISPEGDDIIILQRVSKPRCDTESISPAISAKEHYTNSQYTSSQATHAHLVQPRWQHVAQQQQSHSTEFAYPSFGKIERSYKKLRALQANGPLFTYCSTLHQRSQPFHHPRDARYTRIDNAYYSRHPAMTVVATPHHHDALEQSSQAHLAAYFGTRQQQQQQHEQHR